MDVTIPCPCPSKPHETDTVSFKDVLPFRDVIAMRHAVSLIKAADNDVPFAVTSATLTEYYLLLGIQSWTLVDGEGKPIEPLTRSIRAFIEANFDAALTLSDAADDLYLETVMLPLINRGRTSSPSTPMDTSTSPTTDGLSSPPTPLRPSLTSISQTDDTEPTTDSPSGDSSYSPSLASAGG